MMDEENHATAKTAAGTQGTDPIVLTVTVGFILLFVGASIVDADAVSTVIGEGFS